VVDIFYLLVTCVTHNFSLIHLQLHKSANCEIWSVNDCVSIVLLKFAYLI